MTEKFYKALSISVVPIVMGGADYAARAPPRSYINVLDYESPQELAEYLLHLASHEEEYQQYFWWKVSTNIILYFLLHKIFPFQKHYTVHKDERERAAQAMCKLCEKLNEEKIEVGLNVFYS